MVSAPPQPNPPEETGSHALEIRPLRASRACVGAVGIGYGKRRAESAHRVATKAAILWIRSTGSHKMGSQGAGADGGRGADLLEKATIGMPTFTLTDVSHEVWLES